MVARVTGPAGSRPLSGWGRYPVVDCLVESPSDEERMQELVTGPAGRSLIARGLGRSYGDAALLDGGGLVLDQTRRDRLLAFDESIGLLRCEAGVSLATILDTFLPRGWHVPTMTGTKHVTVGGAIAADVHGKNHHVDGSFGRWVRRLRLLLSSGEILWCGPDREQEAFWATVGGMGLTGVVLDAEIQLIPAESAHYRTLVRRTRDLEETLRVLDEDRSRYSVAWVDGLARGATLGRSVAMLADEAPPSALPQPLRSRPLDRAVRTPWTVPLTPPFSLVGRTSVRAFNALYYASHSSRERLLGHDAFFCPLDRIGSWNRIYGPSGFVQYQALLPREGAGTGLRALLESISAAKAASFLGVLKRTGPGSGGALSFPGEGYTLALDIPRPALGIDRLTRALDEIVVRHRGRVYLAKDATLTPDAFRAMYPGLDAFLAVKSRLDPSGRFASEQSRRLAITADGTREAA